LDVLDVGCGTGGFAREIARLAAARVTGYDRSERFIAFARQQPAPTQGSLAFVVGDAEQLSFASPSFDRVLLSLVLHQLARPPVAVLEAFRVLRPGSRVLVRTIAPDDVGKRVPERYLPAMAAADAARLPRIDEIIDWLDRAGFQNVRVDRHLRNKQLDFADQERELRTEVRCRYSFIADRDVADAIERMREDASAPEDDWIDPRPTYVIVARKAPS
jgi:ubiquinone/menaquinone biosynthesis C-methylase UbiE